jgi:O-acetylhomoserine/O-acetylserine sulfhydrylase-like pyridoxal-dependent enzyme
LTKYIGGHGDALGGALLGPGDVLMELNEEALVHYGGVISPFNAWLIMRGIATLPIRMQAHSSNAMQVAEFLESHPAVRRVNYPGLESHPQHDIALRQMSGFSGMLSFQVKNGPDVARRMIDGHDIALRQMSGFSGMLSFQVKNGPDVARRMIDGLRVIHYAVSLGHRPDHGVELPAGRGAARRVPGIRWRRCHAAVGRPRRCRRHLPGPRPGPVLGAVLEPQSYAQARAYSMPECRRSGSRTAIAPTYKTCLFIE